MRTSAPPYDSSTTRAFRWQSDDLGAHSAHRRAARDSGGRARVRRDEIAPHTARWDRDAYFEPSLVGKLGELGFLGMLIPEEYDGLGLDTLTYLVALEEIATSTRRSRSC